MLDQIKMQADLILNLPRWNYKFYSIRIQIYTD